MKILFAPMEGIAHHLYRRAQAACFKKADEYFMPFICPKNKALTNRERSDINPDNNRGMQAIPQVLTNDADSFLWAADLLQSLGYGEVNLNLGCPSSTVTRKGRGAGFLAFPEKLEQFLDTVFARCPLPISLKSRLGMENLEEFAPLLSLFDRYPVKRLILHPRLRREQYAGETHMEQYRYAVQNFHKPVIYNGDLFTAEKIRAFEQANPAADAVMCGRGFLLHPGLCGLYAGERETRQQLENFHAMLYDGYRRDIGTEAFVLMKMKEIWAMLGRGQELDKKTMKRIHKSMHFAAYEEAVAAAMDEIASRG